MLRLSTVAETVACPLCGHQSQRIHSHYQRTLTDLPWNRVTVRIHLHTRKFFCDNPTCVRRVFTEPVPELAARYARKTVRLADALLQLVYLVGGEAGARIARLLGLQVSPDGLLQPSSKPRGNPRLRPPRGCWASMTLPFAKAFAMERSWSIWNEAVPSICCRIGKPPPSRSGCESIPASRSSVATAPWAMPTPSVRPLRKRIAVADRFHIMKNLMEALEKQVAREYPAIRQHLAPQTVGCGKFEETLRPVGKSDAANRAGSGAWSGGRRCRNSASRLHPARDRRANGYFRTDRAPFFARSHVSGAQRLSLSAGQTDALP